MKKVFYFLNTVPEWVNVVERLKVEKQWEPILWVTSEALQIQISKRLGKTKILDLQSCRRGEFNDFNYSDFEGALDKDLIEEYYFCEKNVIPMMNRMDPTRHNFAYHQRIQLYYKMLIFWIDTFERMKPDLVMFDETPHVPFEYIMHEVALKKNIKIIRCNTTHINNRLLLYGEINETPKYMRDEYQANKGGGPFQLSNDIEVYYEKLQGSYTQAMPFYMKKQSAPISKILKKYFLIFKRALLNKTDPSYYRSCDGYIQDYKTIKIIKILYRIKGRIYKAKLLKKYKQLSSDVSLSESYIYVPLHFQPERTTSPEGDIYENQWLMIQLLAQTLPKGWKLYVKEHISQFRKDFSGQMGRHREFYRDVLLFDNVKLVPLEYSSFDLIDNAKATATISGTVGLESVLRSKRTLIFGTPWFEICEGITRVANKKELIEFFDKMINIPVNQDYVRAFFKMIDDFSLSANHSGGKWNRDLDQEQNIANLTELVLRYEHKLGVL